MFSKNTVADMPQNRFYVGEVQYKELDTSSLQLVVSDGSVHGTTSGPPSSQRLIGHF